MSLESSTYYPSGAAPILSASWIRRAVSLTSRFPHISAAFFAHSDRVIDEPRRQFLPARLERAEHETINWIGFYNTERLHEELGDIPPAEYERNYYEMKRRSAPLEPVQPALE